MSEEKKQVDEKLSNALGIPFDPDDDSTASKGHTSTRGDTVDGTPTSELTTTEDDKKMLEMVDAEKPIEERLMEIDFLHSRARLKRLLERGEEMFEDAYRIAQETDQARSYEVSSIILRDILNGNKDLIKMHSDRSKARDDVLGKDKDSGKGSGGSIGNNNNINVITGTTSDLLDMILEQGENKSKNVVNEANEPDDTV